MSEVKQNIKDASEPFDTDKAGKSAFDIFTNLYWRDREDLKEPIERILHHTKGLDLSIDDIFKPKDKLYYEKISFDEFDFLKKDGLLGSLYLYDEILLFSDKPIKREDYTVRDSATLLDEEITTDDISDDYLEDALNRMKKINDDLNSNIDDSIDDTVTPNYEDVFYDNQVRYYGGVRRYLYEKYDRLMTEDLRDTGNFEFTGNYEDFCRAYAQNLIGNYTEEDYKAINNLMLDTVIVKPPQTSTTEEASSWGNATVRLYLKNNKDGRTRVFYPDGTYEIRQPQRKNIFQSIWNGIKKLFA